MNRLSLRYRIALTSFVLTGAMAAALLRHVQDMQLEAVAAQEAASEAVVTDLLAELSRLAIIRSEYDDLDHHLGRIHRNPHVRAVVVADSGGRVVASTDSALLGRALPPLRDSGAAVWKTRELANASGSQGLLAIEFSNSELVAAERRIRTRAGVLALVGVTVIALVSVVMGVALTRRLALLDRASRRIGDGDFGTRTGMLGADEVSVLGQTLDTMAGKIQAIMDEARSSERRFTGAFEHAPIGMALVGLDNRFLQVNQALCAIVGRPREELLTLAVPDVTHPADWAAEDARKAELRAGRGSGFRMVKRYLRPDGRAVWAQLSVSVVADDLGRPEYFIGQVEDITERKRAEDRIVHLNRLYALLSNVNQAIVRIRDRQALLDEICRVAVEDGKFRMAWIGLVDEASRIVRVAARHGYAGDYLDGLEVPLTGAPEGQGPTGTAVRQGQREVCNDIEHDERMAPWRERALGHGYRASAALPLTVFGATVGALNLYAGEAGVFDDEEVRLLDELAMDVAFAIESISREEEQQKLVSIIETSSDFIGVADLEGRVLYVNDAGRALAGIGAAHPLPRASIADFVAEDDLPAFRGELMPAVMQAGRWSGEFRLRHLTTAEPIPVEMTVLAIQDRKTGKRIALAAMCRDIRERRRTEEALRRSEEQYRLVVENASDGIFITQDERIVFSNAALVKRLEHPREELASRPFSSLVHPDDRQAVLDRHRRRSQGEGLPGTYEFRVVTASGATRWAQLSAVEIEWEGRPATLSFLRDTTQQKQLELQFLHAQKMEAVGQLAGGIAHDFNNMLSAIIGYGNVVLSELPAGAQARADVGEMLTAAERGAELTRSLLTFSRKQVIHPRPVTLDSIVGRVKGLLRRIMGEDIALRTVLAAPRETVLADSGQIEQLLVNLAANSRDAMPKGGQLTLETGRAQIDGDFIRRHGYGRPGPYVLLSVSDTGEGMDEATRQRVFEPFFTTKEVGKGTGLGLAMVYGSVKQHGGFISVESERGKGTTFRIYLPVADAAPASHPAPESRAAPERGTETVLLAEDDHAVRRLTCRVLEDSGYRVIVAQDGHDAVEQLSLHLDRIDLVIVDVVMPGRNGREVVEVARRLKPGIKALFTSGYPADVIQTKGVIEGEPRLLSKPASPRDLLRKVREALDG